MEDSPSENAEYNRKSNGPQLQDQRTRIFSYCPWLAAARLPGRAASPKSSKSLRKLNDLFGYIARNSKLQTSKSLKLYCICQREYKDGSLMIQCEGKDSELEKPGIVV